MLVTKEPIIELWALFLQARNASTVSEEYVQISVVVVIEEGHAAECGIDDGLFRSGTVLEHKGLVPTEPAVLKLNAGRFIACAENNRQDKNPARRPTKRRHFDLMLLTAYATNDTYVYTRGLDHSCRIQPRKHTPFHLCSRISEWKKRARHRSTCRLPRH